MFSTVLKKTTAAMNSPTTAANIHFFDVIFFVFFSSMGLTWSFLPVCISLYVVFGQMEYRFRALPMISPSTET